jgi:uncharacterized protein
MKTSTRLLSVGVLLALPWLILFSAGLWWLWRAGLLWPWLILGAVLSVPAYLLWQGRSQRDLGNLPDADGEPLWPQSSRQVWESVSAKFEASAGDYPLDEELPHKLLDLGLAVTRAVAQYYHPDADTAEWEMPLPHLCKTIELISRDLGELSRSLPLGHVLTLNHYRRLPDIYRVYHKAHTVYRLGHPLLNPTGAVLREIRSYVAGKVTDTLRTELSAWLMRNYIREVARYAVNLYSGALLLEQGEAAPSTSQSLLRILVVGQAKSGKSTLINALLNETQAQVDALPATAALSPYVLKHADLPPLLMLDSRAYGSEINPEVLAEIPRCDAVLLVCAAPNAARQADLAFRRALAQSAAAQHSPLPLLCVLSHIDRLPPTREWQPPYDIANPGDNIKARHIRQAVETVAAEIEVLPTDVIPVCLQSGAVYNLSEGLIPALHQALPEARRHQYARVLTQGKSIEHWQLLRKQATAVSRLVKNVAAHARAKFLNDDK